jgi:heme iron utilization protein
MTSVNPQRPILDQLCSTQPLAVLATAAGTDPYVNLVAVVFGADLRQLYFATARTTRKWRNLAANPRVSLLLDNRSNQVTDFSQAAAATVIGTAFELTGADRDKAANLYLARHPHLADFISSADCALVGVAIDHIYLVTSFQQVVEFSFAG